MNIMDKIEKLLALAGNNPNKEEAQSALLKAQELMAKYNVSVDPAERKKEELYCKTVEKHSRLRKGARNSLTVIIARAFAVKCVIVGDKPTFFGYRENVDAAVSAFVFCAKAMNHNACKEMRSSPLDDTYVYNSYIFGFLDGLRSKFDEQCKALMIVVPTEVENGFKEKFTSLKPCVRSSVHGSRSNNYYNSGYAAGRSAMDRRSLDA